MPSGSTPEIPEIAQGLNPGYRHSTPISTPKGHPWGPTFGCIWTHIHGGGSLATVAREPPEWVPNRTIRPWGLFVLPHSLYIPSRARVGRIGSDSMIHISQNVIFDMFKNDNFPFFPKCFRTRNIHGPKMGHFRPPKWSQNGTPEMDPFPGHPGDHPGPPNRPYGPLRDHGQGSKYGPILAPKRVPKWTILDPQNGVSKSGPILSTFSPVPIRSSTRSGDPGSPKITQGSFFVLMPLDPKIGMCPKQGFRTPKITDLGHRP